MNIAIVSYSFTGKNDRFAECLAKELSAELVRIQPKKAVSYGSLTWDLLLQRKPAAEPEPESLQRFELLLFVAPVWMGQVAFPLRAYLAALKQRPKAYGFLSISGGADSGNPWIAAELMKRTGREPILVLDQGIRDLLQKEPAPTRDGALKYQLNAEDCARITKRALEQLRKTVPAAF
ncbi:MAG: hypothetical protein LLF75_12525 [Eubacteriales bacterium]|nr:hypothetical protein [Eubacteriales bacterium]